MIRSYAYVKGRFFGQFRSRPCFVITERNFFVMEIRLSDHFTYKKLLRYTVSPVIMMIFTSIYGVIDGLFVSNCVGSNAFAAVNLILPFVFGLGSVGFMIGTGGSAIVGKTLGEGSREKANKYFSMLITALCVSAFIMSVIGIIFIRPIAIKMGADKELLPDCVAYGRILLIGLVPYMLQVSFQSFFSVAEMPKTGLYVTVVSGLTNAFLDWVFISALELGVTGAAIATVAGYIVGGVIPFFFFLKKKDDSLCLVRPEFHGKVLLKSCVNGSSEMLTNLSLSIVNIIYNIQLLNIAGKDGVAAYGVIMYVNFIFVSAFLGYSLGCAPIVSFHYGAGNKDELFSLLKKSLAILCCVSAAMLVISLTAAPLLAKIYVGYDRRLFDMTCHGFRLCSFNFLFCGINIFGSAFFTALNNGVISAVISFLRTLVFQIIMILLLPALFGLNGIWLGTAAAEFLMLFVTLPLLRYKAIK